MDMTAGADGATPGGILVTSLDFELAWGLRESRGGAGWRDRVAGARAAVPRLLDALTAHGIRATWGTVGMLALEGPDELRALAPATRARFANPALCAYTYADEVLGEAGEAPLHFAPDLVRLIADAPGQELATHTFAHYHCAEAGHSAEAFEADLIASLDVLARFGARPRSIIFPKNQVVRNCLGICARHSIEAYRGNPPGWLFAPRSSSERGPSLRRGVRLIDEVLPLSGRNCYPLSAIAGEEPRNVLASRLLRPGRGSTAFDRLLVRRVCAGLEHAARRGLVFHLWWHPHNFAPDTDRRLALLERALGTFDRLRDERGMRSMTMLEAARAAGGEGTGS